MHVDPNTGSEIVERVKGSMPKPGDTNFVGPVDPSQDPSFSQGKAAAKQDFNRTVSWATSIALWIFIPLAILVALASFVVPWIPTKASIYCAGAACAVVSIRYALLSFGVLAVDIAVYVSAAAAVVVGLFVGLPMVIAWTKKHSWSRAVLLASEGQHIDGAVALAASVDPAIDKQRSSVVDWLETYHSGLKDAVQRGLPSWTEAQQQLVKLGVIKPEGK